MTAKGVAVPPALADALQRHSDALAVFEAMRPSCQREYADWVASAKQAETRARRVPKAVQRILEYGARHPEKLAAKPKRKINAAWHASHPMPPAATPATRLRWHLEHQKHCGCRPIPPRLVAWMLDQK